MSEPKRFHPLSLVIHLFKLIRASIFFIFLFIIKGDSNLLINSLILLGYLGLLFIYSLFKYQTTKYLINDEHIQLFKGILNKKVQTIPYERIQTIDQNQWFFLKPFHLVELSIDTATKDGDEAEVHLTTVPEQVLKDIERYRQHLPELTPEQEIQTIFSTSDATVNSPFYRTQLKDILIFALTDLRILATFLVLASFTDNLQFDWFDHLVDRGEAFLNQATIIAWIILAILGILLTIIASIINYVIRYYNFTVLRTDHHLRIESGLLQRRTQVIEIAKIQSIMVRQQFLRQMFHLATIDLAIMGDMKDTNNEDTGTVTLFPIVPLKIVQTQLSEFLPEFYFPENHLQHVTKGNQSSIWYFIRWSIIWPLLGGVSYFFFSQPWLIGISLILFIAHAGTGLYRKAHQAYTISDNLLKVQSTKGFTKTLLFVERRKIQSLSENTSKWLFKKQKGHIHAFVPSGNSHQSIELKYMNDTFCQNIIAFYRKKRTL